ncbi:MAG TPA: hypothetical protein VMT00_05410 [Thermoanaerobaculia bacterium]|nr:hypothetical protein [Thermoanaerobaculia bacterium]
MFLLETDRQTWIAVMGVDTEGKETMFRLAFTTMEKAVRFAAAHEEMSARRLREVRLRDIMGADEPPLALDLEPESV